MRRYRLIAGLVVAIAATPTLAMASTAGRGTATTSVSILSINAQGKAIEVGTGTGRASTDMIRQQLQESAVAEMSIIGASVVGVATTPNYAVTSDSRSRPIHELPDAAGIPLGDGPTIEGSAALQLMKAQVDKALPSARSTLGHLKIDMSMINGMLTLSGLDLAIDNISDPDQAIASQTVGLSRLSLLPFSEILDRATNLTIDDVLDLATQFGDEATRTNVDEVEAAKADVITAVNNAQAGTIVGDISVDSLVGCDAPLTQTLCDNPDVTARLGDLQAAKDALRATLGSLPLLDIRDLVAGILAQATDFTSTATVDVNYTFANVLGVSLPKPPNADIAFSDVATKLGEVETRLKSVSGLENISLTISPLAKDPKTGTDGDYKTASAAVTVVRVHAAMAQGAGVSSPLSFDLDLLKIATDAEHKPSILGGGLARTGTSPLLPLCGIVLVGLGLRLRRTLGDAA